MCYYTHFRKIRQLNRRILESFCIVQVATVILHTNLSLTPKPGLTTFFPCHQRYHFIVLMMMEEELRVRVMRRRYKVAGCAYTRC